jgi:hypothetical protein
MRIMRKRNFCPMNRNAENAKAPKAPKIKHSKVEKNDITILLR